MNKTKKATFIFILLSLIGISSNNLNAQDIYESKYSTSSKFIKLNGEWDFRFDAENVGEKEQWQNKPVRKNWDKIEVPSTYNVAFPEKYYYFGFAWYKKTIKIDKQELIGKRVILHINGAGLRSNLWINGSKAGNHNSPYSDFSMDITGFINGEIENIIAIRTDNKIDKSSVPDRFGWWPYGGLYRDVYLEIIPEIAIENVWIDTNQKHGEWDFSINCIINNPSHKGESAKLEFALKDGQKIIWSSKNIYELDKIKTKISLDDKIQNVIKWDTDNPKLYELTVSIKYKNQKHSRSVKVGFRDVKVEGSKIVVNNKSLLIKGINYHEDHPDYGSTMPKEQIKRDLLAIKELGVNLIRSAHYTHDQYFYDLCDEMGFLVWAEIPAWQTSTKLLADPSVWVKYLEPQLTDMVMQYRSHPSIIIWSVGNEFDSNNKEALQYVRKSVKYVRSLDTTRLITYASDKHRKDDDICFQEVDFISINEYYGWYYGTLYDLGNTLDRLHGKYPNKPIVVSEFNAGAALDSVANDNYSAVRGKQYTLEYQNKFLTVHMDQIFHPDRIDYVSGGIIWLYSDYADIHRVGGGHPKQWDYVNLKGLVNQQRERKPSFDLVKRYYNSISEPLAQLSEVLISQALPGYIKEKSAVEYPIGKDGLKWHKAIMGNKNAVDLIKQLELKDDCHAYAATEIFVESDISTTLLFGRNDGAAIWLNGELIYENFNQHAFVYNEFSTPIKLKKGKNLLVLLLSQGGGNWEFNFNLETFNFYSGYPEL